MPCNEWFPAMVPNSPYPITIRTGPPECIDFWPTPDGLTLTIVGQDSRWLRETPERLAAEELLAACKEALFWIRGTEFHEEPVKIEKRLEDAIAKAEGREG